MITTFTAYTRKSKPVTAFQIIGTDRVVFAKRELSSEEIANAVQKANQLHSEGNLPIAEAITRALAH